MLFLYKVFRYKRLKFKKKTSDVDVYIIKLFEHLICNNPCKVSNKITFNKYYEIFSCYLTVQNTAIYSVQNHNEIL